MNDNTKQSYEREEDKAGVGHWDETYVGLTASVFNPHPKGIRYSGRKKWHELFSRMLCSLEPSKKTLIEVGCGGSKYLPYFGKEFQFAVSGLDYSVNGCVMAEKCLSLANVEGTIYYGDLFSPPDQLIGTYDVAVSFGVVEHFSDTASPVSHIAILLKPGGLIVTIVPNMAGIAGFAQKIICRDVYDKHMPLSRENLVAAHEKSGLTIVEAGHLEFVNFGVVNIGTNSAGVPRLMKLLGHKLLLGVTLVTWTLEAILGPFAANSATSPYLYCIAKKPAQ